MDEVQNNPQPQSQPVSVIVDPLEGKAKASLILGIVGLIAWLLPIVGIPVTIVGIVKGVQAWKSSKHTLAVAGVVLSIIGLVLAIINMAIGAYIGATGQHPLVNEMME